MKEIYAYGIKLIECECGVWREPLLPCWNHEDRRQMMVEAHAQFAQSLRNLGYQIAKSLRLIK